VTAYPHHGAALVLGLVLIASMSLLAVASSSGAALQSRMAANWQERTAAWVSASLADAEARRWLASRPAVDRGPDCSPGVMQPFAIHARESLPVDVAFQAESWWNSQAIQANRHPELGTQLVPAGDLPGSVYWLIEEVHCEPAVTMETPLVAWYRILAWAGGRLPGSVVVTESIVARPWGEEIAAMPYPSSSGSSGFSVFCAPVQSAPCGRKAWRQLR
jgi:Tfp pilus assembly protein PilX